MKNVLKKPLSILCFLLVFAYGCSDEPETKPNVPDDNREGHPISAKDMTNASGPVSPGAFSLWQSCSTYPYYISGTNGICIPVGGTECGTNYLGAQQNGGQYATGLQFTGTFKGGSNAPNGSNEMAVFICDNVSSWTGREMGFVKTLSDNTLKAYIQSPGQYIYQTLYTGGSGYHTYKCQVRSASQNSLVDFYVDGVYQCTLNNPGVNYWNQWYYFVGTTHRTSGGWGSGGQQIEMYDMQTF